MKVILFRPEIPQNTGNIVRTCAVTGAELVLVTPLGFSTSSRMLKRAGLDYWENVSVTYIDDLTKYLEQTTCPFYFFSSKASTCYASTSYSDDAILIFGSETSGLPILFHEKWPDHFLTIPMQKNSRCLNLSNAVSIVIYEAWRQQGFATSSTHGLTYASI
jgi:tRNA (cytidine/uridine-2'-O-)-methyltransferase